MSDRRGFSILSLAIILFSGKLIAAESDLASRLNVDMSARYLCAPKSKENFEHIVESYFSKQGYKFINKASLANSQKEFSPFETDIIAISNDDLIIDVKRFKNLSPSYFISVTTRPPTKHAVMVERDFVDLISNALGCLPERVEFHDNPIESEAFFDRVYTKTQYLINKFKS